MTIVGLSGQLPRSNIEPEHRVLALAPKKAPMVSANGKRVPHPDSAQARRCLYADLEHFATMFSPEAAALQPTKGNSLSDSACITPHTHRRVAAMHTPSRLADTCKGRTLDQLLSKLAQTAAARSARPDTGELQHCTQAAGMAAPLVPQC